MIQHIFKIPRKHPVEELEIRLQNPTRRNEDPLKIYCTHTRKTENPARPNSAQTNHLLEDSFQKTRPIPLNLRKDADPYPTTTTRFRFSANPPESTP